MNAAPARVRVQAGTSRAWTARASRDPVQAHLSWVTARARTGGPFDADAVSISMDALDAVDLARQSGATTTGVTATSIEVANRAVGIAAKAAVTQDRGTLEHARGLMVTAWLAADYSTCPPEDPDRVLPDVWLRVLGLLPEEDVKLRAERAVEVLERLLAAADRPAIWSDPKALREYVARGLVDPAQAKSDAGRRVDSRRRGVLLDQLGIPAWSQDVAFRAHHEDGSGDEGDVRDHGVHADRVHRQRGVLPWAEPQLSPDACADVELVTAVLSKLSPGERAAVELKAADLSEAEIAERLGKSRRTVRTWLNRAQQKTLRILSPETASPRPKG